VCTAPECLRARSAGQETVCGRGAGKWGRTGKPIALSVGSGAQRGRFPAEAGLGTGVGLFEIDL
jgi:hypothetical protein